MAVTFKRQHRVDDMFEQFWSGDRTVFGDVSDQHHGTTAIFGEARQCLRAFTHLRDRARRALDARKADRLDGVDYEQRRPHRICGREQRVDIRVGDKHDLARSAHALGAHLRLPG